MREIKVNRNKLEIKDGKVVTRDLVNLIEEESIELDANELENSNNLYVVLKDK